MRWGASRWLGRASKPKHPSPVSLKASRPETMSGGLAEQTSQEDKSYAGHNPATSDRSAAHQSTRSTRLSPGSHQQHHTDAGEWCSSVAATLASRRCLARYAHEPNNGEGLPWRQCPALDGHWPPKRLRRSPLDDLQTSFRTGLAGAQRREGYPD